MAKLKVTGTTLGSPTTIEILGLGIETYSLTARSGLNTATIMPAGSSGSTVTWTAPITWASSNTTGTTISITFDLDAELSTDASGTWVFTIPAGVVPTAALTISDAMGYASTYGSYVQTKSKIAFSLTGTGIYGSTITAQTVSIDGRTLPASGTTHVLENDGAQNAVGTVTDSRGRQGTVTVAYTVLPYHPPLYTKFEAERTDSLGNPSPIDEYITITFDSDISALNNLNHASYELWWKRTDQDDLHWQSATLSTYQDNLQVSNGTYTFAADEDSPYDVLMMMTDDFSTSYWTSTAPMAFALMNFRAEGDGVAFGGINTQSGLQIYMDTDFSGNVTMSPPLGIAAGGTGGITQYNSHDSGSLTAALNRTKTYTVAGGGFVFVSASLRSGTKTWGTSKITIFHNTTEISKATDIITANYDGQETSANATAFIQVSNGDTVKVEAVSTRYTSGNTWDEWFNVLAFGCTLTVS